CLIPCPLPSPLAPPPPPPPELLLLPPRLASDPTIIVVIMRKRLAQYRKLGRTPEHKWAMLRNMVTSLIKHERIVTTAPKAKELRHLAEKVVGYTKKKHVVHGKQMALRIIREEPVVTKLFDILGPRYEDRDGGYTRVMKLSRPRKGDNAPMAAIEYVDRPGEIRAARVPKRRKEKYFQNLEEVLKNAGIEPIEPIEPIEDKIRTNKKYPTKKYNGI
ncbi:hypothetical protein ACHAWF_018158, partial [Thalassiosira exigua]